MTAWKPPERVWVYTDRPYGLRVEVYDPEEIPHPQDVIYIPESVALERGRVLREALEEAREPIRRAVADLVANGGGFLADKYEALLDQIDAALDSQKRVG